MKFRFIHTGKYAVSLEIPLNTQEIQLFKWKFRLIRTRKSTFYSQEIQLVKWKYSKAFNILYNVHVNQLFEWNFAA